MPVAALITWTSPVSVRPTLPRSVLMGDHALADVSDDLETFMRLKAKPRGRGISSSFHEWRRPTRLVRRIAILKDMEVMLGLQSADVETSKVGEGTVVLHHRLPSAPSLQCL